MSRPEPSFLLCRDDSVLLKATKQHLAWSSPLELGAY